MPDRRKLALKEKVALYGATGFLLWSGLFFVNPAIPLGVALFSILFLAIGFAVYSVTMAILLWVYDNADAEYTPEWFKRMYTWWYNN